VGSHPTGTKHGEPALAGITLGITVGANKSIAYQYGAYDFTDCHLSPPFPLPY
jgi:hypothetical protein